MNRQQYELEKREYELENSVDRNLQNDIFGVHCRLNRVCTQIHELIEMENNKEDDKMEMFELLKDINKRLRKRKNEEAMELDEYDPPLKFRRLGEKESHYDDCQPTFRDVPRVTNYIFRINANLLTAEDNLRELVEKGRKKEVHMNNMFDMLEDNDERLQEWEKEEEAKREKNEKDEPPAKAHEEEAKREKDEEEANREKDKPPAKMCKEEANREKSEPQWKIYGEDFERYSLADIDKIEDPKFLVNMLFAITPNGQPNNADDWEALLTMQNAISSRISDLKDA